VTPHHLIGEILCDLGYLTQAQLNEGRRVQMSKPKVYLGEHLLNLGYISLQQLEQALKKQVQEDQSGP